MLASLFFPFFERKKRADSRDLPFFFLKGMRIALIFVFMRGKEDI